MGAAGVPRRELREGEAHLVVEGGDRDRIDPTVERHEGAAVEPAEPRARDPAHDPGVRGARG
jgi:hypothetical protein